MAAGDAVYRMRPDDGAAVILQRHFGVGQPELPVRIEHCYRNIPGPGAGQPRVDGGFIGCSYPDLYGLSESGTMVQPEIESGLKDLLI